MMLCCLHDGFNGTVGLSLSQVFLESISEDGQLAIGLEGPCCINHRTSAEYPYP